jgi:uncharacterized protein
MEFIKQHPLKCFFILSYFISWVIWMPLYLPYFGIHNLPVLPYHHALGALGPFCSAFIISWFEGGSLAIKKLGAKLIHWRIKFHLYLIAIFSPLVILAGGGLLAYTINNHPIKLSISTSNEFPEFNLALFFIYNLFTFGYGEETGWRGFALTHLQNKFSVLKSTLILSIFWAGWHIPLFLYRPGYSGMEVSGIIGWLMSVITGAILLSWLYNKSNGSILLVSIFHAAIDIPFTSSGDAYVINYMGALITIWGILAGIIICKNNQKAFS